MRIGVDFDNTIVCYDEVFHKVAADKGLIPADLPVSKNSVRDYLRKIGKEDLWTELQGYIYGPRMTDAAPFAGVLDFFKRCRQQGISICIISHKTRYPFLGPQYDLHRAARDWLAARGFHDPARVGLPESEVYLELTKEAKLQRIAQTRCTHFIDDLPEFLAEENFPPNVERILFDPNGHAVETPFRRAASWSELGRIFFGEQTSHTPHTETIRPLAERLVKSAGFSRVESLTPLPGGANNQVYRLCADGASLLLKIYFQHPNDTRDRLRAEFSLGSFAWRHGLRCVAQPLACDPENRMGLYEFIEGRLLTPSEVAEDVVRQALDFFLELNRHKGAPDAADLPIGSEACFTLKEHLDCVQWRIGHLQSVGANSPDIDGEASQFVREHLLPRWHKLAESVRQRGAADDIAFDTPIAARDRCVSPSDFGFHNALLEKSGRLRFIDFEYAGWDDPAKTVCDFFCQPAVPVPMKFYPMMAEAIAAQLSDSASHRRRFELLLPVYQMKWCCIMLNDFLLVGAQRRRFAQQIADPLERKVRQLEKARRALEQIHF